MSSAASSEDPFLIEEKVVGAGRIIQAVLYTVIFLVGTIGNTLVIYVVVRYSRMQTITNVYIVNLAIADECYLASVPFLITTMLKDSFIFGTALCKVYFISTGINQFTSGFLVLIISIDRYIAVCRTRSSTSWRTPLISTLLCLMAWTLSALLMIPIIKHAALMRTDLGDHCILNWNNEELDWRSNNSRFHSGQPVNFTVDGDDAEFDDEFWFTIYTCLIGFLIPFSLILVFYCLIIKKLWHVRKQVKRGSKEKDRFNTKVTMMVLTVIAVFVICGLPFWIIQLMLVNNTIENSESRSRAFVDFVSFAYCLVYCSPALNPIIYAFLSDNYRKSFAKAFSCRCTEQEVNETLHEDRSVFPAARRRGRGKNESAALPASSCAELSDVGPSRRNSSMVPCLNDEASPEDKTNGDILQVHNTTTSL